MIDEGVDCGKKNRANLAGRKHPGRTAQKQSYTRNSFLFVLHTINLKIPKHIVNHRPIPDDLHSLSNNPSLACAERRRRISPTHTSLLCGILATIVKTHPLGSEKNKHKEQPTHTHRERASGRGRIQKKTYPVALDRLAVCQLDDAVAAVGERPLWRQHWPPVPDPSPLWPLDLLSTTRRI